MATPRGTKSRCTMFKLVIIKKCECFASVSSLERKIFIIIYKNISNDWREDLMWYQR